MLFSRNAEKVLVVAAHPDDEVLGLGGTLLCLRESGAELHLLIMADGIGSRFEAEQESDIRSKELAERRKCTQAAVDTLGIKSWKVLTHPDNSLDTVPLLTLCKDVDEVISEIKPDVIFTHHAYDLNVDHRLTTQAVMTVCRPQGAYTPRLILAYETPSSTEWQIQDHQVFKPNVFVDLGYTLVPKMRVVACYDRELRPLPHSRSETGIAMLAGYRGGQCGCHYAEAFELLRGIC